MTRLILILLFVFSTSPTLGQQEVTLGGEQESRARDLFKQIRCVVCQNQSIDDSNADIARDLRNRIRDEIKAGKTDTQIEDLLVSVYGEFVLLNPRFGWHTVILWGSPLIFLSFGIFAFWRVTRSPNRPPKETNN